jgi:hydroxyethylthiazole kinase-like uncharacterized protein yjeF
VKVVTVNEMRSIEEACAATGRPPDVLMENAGKAVAEQVRDIVGTVDGQGILLLIGPGNNGGDGLVSARYLHDWGASVSVYLLSNRPDDDPNLKLVREREITCVQASRDEDLATLGEMLSEASVVVDAIFGTGRSRPLAGIFREALEAVNRERISRPNLRLFALDLPSGLDADTGLADVACLHVDNTITLGFPKAGLFNTSEAAKAGRITTVDIGIPDGLADEVSVELITDDWARSVLPKRPLLANKGSFGRVLVVAGSERYIGAAYLACSGAMRVGAGLVTLATTPTVQSIVASALTEATYLPLPEAHRGIFSPEAAGILHEELGSYGVLLMGCGLGQNPTTVEFIRKALFGQNTAQLPLVLDADALNILAGVPNWWQQLPDDAILTPHPGEMSRLAGVTIDEVQSDRIGTARRAAREWQKTVILKGAYSVVAASDGRCMVSAIANPGLASAGTGDVLAGAIAGLRVQGLSSAESAACGVYLHGQAGENVKARLGDTGMVASDLLLTLPLVIKQLKEDAYDTTPTE